MLHGKRSTSQVEPQNFSWSIMGETRKNDRPPVGSNIYPNYVRTLYSESTQETPSLPHRDLWLALVTFQLCTHQLCDFGQILSPF